MNRNRWTWMFLVGACVLMISAVAWAQDYTYITVDDPAADQSQVTGINDLGELVGISLLPGEQMFTHPFYATGNPPVVHQVNLPGFLPADGNNKRIVVGTRYPDGALPYAVARKGPNEWRLDFPGATQTWVDGLTENTIFGTYATEDGAWHGFTLDIQTHVWTTVDIEEDLDRSFVVTGVETDGALVGNLSFEAIYRDTQGTVVALWPPAVETESVAVSRLVEQKALVRAYPFSPEAQVQTFVYDTVSDTYTEVAVTGGTDTQGYDLNAAGQVVGRYVDASGTPRGFIATPAQPMVSTR